MIQIVCALGQNQEIGRDNAMLWHLPNDFKFFKEKTLGTPVIMGRKTFESIGKPLPGRTNIVITRQQNYFLEGALVVGNLKQALKHASRINDTISIIGGGQIFKEAIPLADRLILTWVEATFPEADVFFPEFNPLDWEMVSTQENPIDHTHPYPYRFVIYNRITH